MNEEIWAGREALAQGRRMEALESFGSALRRDASSVEAWLGLSRSLRHLGRSPLAVNVLEGLRAPPSHERALAQEQAWALETANQHAAAADAWRRVLDLSSGQDEGSDDVVEAWTRYLSSLYLSGQQLNEPLPSAVQVALPASWVDRTHGWIPRARVHSGFGEADPPLRVDTGGTAQAAETHLSRSAAGEIVLAWNDMREPGMDEAWSLGVALSQDDGATWTDSLLRPPGNVLADFEGDPMTAYDPRTGNLWVGGISFFPARSVFVARKRPGAADLDPVVVLLEDQVFDKGFLAAGPVPGNPNSTRLYAAYNLGLQTSDDLGSSWTPLLPMPSGVSQHPRIGPGGELYMTYWDFADGIWLIRSFDGGETLEDPIRVATRLDVWDAQDGSRFPGRFRVAPIAYLAVSPVDGSLAVVYFDTTSVDSGEANVDLYLTRSMDQGSTWSTPTVVNGDSDPPADQFFPWLEIDGEGRFHLAYLDTRHVAQVDDQPNGFFDVMYSTSVDGGMTWSETRLTSTSFSSSSATWPGFEQFLGDFISLVPTPDGALVAYPATFDGDLDIYVQRVRHGGEIFADGFESGDTTSWSSMAVLNPL